MQSQDLPNNIPDTPGIYFFRSGEKVLYIGKATSLRDRVKSYFSQDIIETRGPKILKMLEMVDHVTWQETDSVLEALILESRLIKEKQPEYNTREKDNKSYNYVVITEETFPRVFTVRERELLATGKLDFKVKKSFGPFPHGQTLREALKILRKIFPFRDKKSKEKSQARFYEMLGLAPDVAQKEAEKNYAQTIKNLTLFFEGKKSQVIKSLMKEMTEAANERRFEEAEIIKRQLFALQHIQDIALIKDDFHGLHNTKLARIEAYDVAHLSGTSTVGVMTVVVNGEVDRNEYRKFKIKSLKKGSDVDALKELLERRLGHPEWGMPTMIVVDGGTAQKNVAEKILREAGVRIPVISVVKDERHKPKEIRGQSKLVEEFQKEILLANAEAHRFAVEYHKVLRKKSLA